MNKVNFRGIYRKASTIYFLLTDCRIIFSLHEYNKVAFLYNINLLILYHFFLPK